MADRRFLVGDSVFLRAMEPEDLEIMYEMENDSASWDVANFNVPYSRFALKQYMENSQCDMYADKQLRLMIVLKENKSVVGTIDITDFVPRHGRGEVGIGIRRDLRGRGYGTEALGLLCEYAFRFLCLRQLTAHVAVDNQPSLRLFHSCGFAQCGLLKEWWWADGQYKDVLLLQCLNPVGR